MRSCKSCSDSPRTHVSDLIFSIRPLLSHDLKLRKVSGRHQISSDGKHLFDGSVFGRPRPRGPVDRPAIDIPPRKRRRITYDEDTDSSLDESSLAIEGQAQLTNDSDGNRQLILSAEFDDDDDDDEDFEPNEGDEEEDSDGDILEAALDSDRPPIIANRVGNEYSGEDSLADIPNDDLRSNVQTLRDTFPKAPTSVCKHILLGCDSDLMKAWDILSQGFKPSKPRKAIEKPLEDQEASHSAKARSRTKKSSKHTKLSLVEHDSASDLNDEGGEPPPNDQDASLLQYYDQHGLPAGSIPNGKALTQLATIVASKSTERLEEQNGRTPGRRVSTSTAMRTRSVRFCENNPTNKASEALALDCSDESNDEDFEAETSSIKPDNLSHGSAGDSSDKDDGESTSSEETSNTSSSESISSSGSYSDADSDSGPEELSSRPAESLPEAYRVALETDSQANNPPSEALKAQEKAPVPPGQGKKSTRVRNQRRRNLNVLQRFKDKGILPAGTTLREMNQLEMDKIRTPEDALQALAEIRTKSSQTLQNSGEKAATKAAEFEAKRQQLLASLASGGVEVCGKQPSGSSNAARLASASTNIGMSVKTPVHVAAEYETPFTIAVGKATESVGIWTTEKDPLSSAPAVVPTSVESPAQSPVVSSRSTPAEPTPRPRRKIDLRAAGRLLFGALGVQAPKTKADHEKIRNDLMKDIRPSKPVITAEEATKEDEVSNNDEDPEAWRNVINLRAVECCHDGVKLSPAPFPFVQRWDPQQQGSYWKESNRGQKSKKGQRNQPQYYNDDHHLSKKRKRNQNQDDTYIEPSGQYLAADDADDGGNSRQDEDIEMEPNNAPDTQLVYTDGVEGAVNDQIMKDVQEAATSQAIDEDDLPRLPENITVLHDFTGDDIKPGMVIAFKQLILSEATNWQPQLSNYRTAVVIKAPEDGELELRLAKRDRAQAKKYYDVETGERIYGKFDMPTDDDHDDAEDDGFLGVTINELIEPKIVQLAPESLGIAPSSPEVAPRRANISADDSTTLGHSNSAETSKASFEAPQNVDKETAGHQDLPVEEADLHSIRDGGDHSADKAGERLAHSISESAREEISELIKEAGFRTSIPSSVLRAQAQLPITPRSDSEKGSYSPKFNGFGSSPSIQAISSPADFDGAMPNNEDFQRPISSNNDTPENKSSISSVHYPKLSVPSSLASQVSDRGRQPDYPIPGDDTLHQFDEMDSFLGDHQGLSGSKDQDPPFTPAMDASNGFPRDNARSSPYSEFEPPSSEGLPTLDEVFSTARSSIGPRHEKNPWLSRTNFREDDKKIEESYNKAMEELDAKLDEAEDEGQITPKASQNHRSRKYNVAAASQDSGSQFKIPPGSQQVDLTLSSDSEPIEENEDDGDDSYDDGFGLPRGPGWVEKKPRRIRRRTTGNSQLSSQKGTQTRVLRRRTTSKF